jgi:phosphinothricin acetyltransferase
MTLRIRPATPDDARGIHEIYRPIVLETVISFELDPPDVGELDARVQSNLLTHPWLVCATETGRVAGYGYADRLKAREAYEWSTEVSAYTHPDFQRRGIARALYTALFAILTHQGFVNALAGIALPNDASIALHEGMGFTAVGTLSSVGYKLGGWRDVGWWEMRLQRPPDVPAAPRPFREIREDAEVQAALAAGEALLRSRP